MAFSDTLNALRALDTDIDTLEAFPLRIGDHLDGQLARPAHIRSAFVDRDAVRVLRHEGATMAIVTKRIDAGRPFVWVLTLFRTPDAWNVGDAIRLYDDDARMAAWWADPLEAFAHTLERYGLDFIAGSAIQPVRFAPFVRFPAPNGRIDLDTLISTLDLKPSGRFHLGQMLRVTQEGEGQLAFAYFVDDAKYAAEAKAAGRNR
jgi:hypothetical protein